MALTSVPETQAVSAPPLRLLLRECAVPLDWARSRGWPHRRLRGLARGHGQPVLVLPGYLTSDRATRSLRWALRTLGYSVHGWGSGLNLGFSRPLIEALLLRLRQLHDAHDQPVSLVGWSLGGIIARELARQAPEEVRMVITLGSPFRGNPRANHLWPIYRWMRARRRPPSTAAAAAPHPLSLPLPVPTTCLYSRRDGFVAWQCCMSEAAPQTENIEVRCSHLAYGLDATVLAVVADRLALPAGDWRPFTSPPLGHPPAA